MRHSADSRRLSGRVRFRGVFNYSHCVLLKALLLAGQLVPAGPADVILSPVRCCTT